MPLGGRREEPKFDNVSVVSNASSTGLSVGCKVAEASPVLSSQKEVRSPDSRNKSRTADTASPVIVSRRKQAVKIRSEDDEDYAQEVKLTSASEVTQQGRERSYDKFVKATKAGKIDQIYSSKRRSVGQRKGRKKAQKRMEGRHPKQKALKN